MRGKFIITAGAVWSNNLTDVNSNAYRELKAGVETQINNALDTSPVKENYRGVKQMSFRQGSVVVDYILEFSDPSQPISESVITNQILTKVNNNDFGSYTVDPQSVSHELVVTESTTEPVEVTTEETEKELPNWAIAVIACGSAVLIFLLALICVLCRRRHVTHKYALPEDPDDIGYRRSWATNNTQHNPEYVYDNKFALNDEDVADRGEVKSPVAYYNLSDQDLKEGNGRVAGAAGSRDSVDPTLINVHDWPPVNGSANRAVLYFYDNTKTFYDQESDTWETKM